MFYNCRTRPLNTYIIWLPRLLLLCLHVLQLHTQTTECIYKCIFHCWVYISEDEDYVPPHACVPGATRKRTLPNAPLPTAPGVLQPQPGPSAPHRPTAPELPQTTRRKRGRPSLGTSAPAKCGAAKMASSRTAEEGDRWHGREEAIKPAPLRFKLARDPGPACDTSKAWSPLDLFNSFSNAVVTTIIKNTNAARRKQSGVKFKWDILNLKDFYIFLSIIVFTGLVTMHERADYWRSIWPYNLQFPLTRCRGSALRPFCGPSTSATRKRTTNDERKNTPAYDRFFKIKPLYTDIVSACQANSTSRTNPQDGATNFFCWLICPSATPGTFMFMQAKVSPPQATV